MATLNRSIGFDLAIGIGLALLVILGAIFGLVWLAHRRAQSRVQNRLKEIRSKTTDLMDRLDALKERIKLLPATDPDFQAPMSGQTLELYNTIQGSLGTLWDRWLQVMDALDRAQKLASSRSSPFQRKALSEAEALLEQKGVFEEIEQQAQAIIANLDRLNQAHETARGVRHAIDAAKPKLASQVEAIRKLNLPTDPYQEELGAIAAGMAEADTILTADPIGTVAALEALRTRAERLLGRLERVASLFQDAKQVGTALEGVRRQVSSHRAQGLPLAEEGGNPDRFLEQGDQAHGQAITALGAGDPDAAAQALESARTMVQQAQATIEQVQKARAYCQREQPNRVRETSRLRAAIVEAEGYHRQLESGFAPTSWQPVARNLDQARALLATFDRMAEDAAAMAAPASQHYVAAAKLIEQLAQQQRIVLRLMSGLGEQLNALTTIRGACQKRRGELEALARRVEGYFRQHDSILGAMARNSLDAASQARDQTFARMEAPQPDWPAVGQGLAQALEEFAIAQSQAEGDVRNHEALRTEYDRARRELERVAALLSSRREDRVAANEHFRAAAAVLDQLELDLSATQGEWTRLLERVRGAVEDLQAAERLARQDIELAGQARSMLDQADQAIRQARGYSPWGVSAETSSAEAALNRAEQHFGAQDYEQAIQLAGAAVQQARLAYQAAVQQASWQQMQAEANQRRWQAGSEGSAIGAALSAGAAAAAVAAGVILDRVAQAASQASSPPPPDSLPVETPQAAPESPPTTWESDSEPSTW
ncbi:MAG TPA: hypothetical protein VFF52_13345 [Isosphaeraceae bacterium]|nr:hypothetical protein [Isosphaeraceae bacterium]